MDILLTAEGLQTVHQRLDRLGYVPPSAGSKHLRDVETGVRIVFLVTRQFPGDGKPKPAPFPDPAAVGVEIEGIRYLRLESLLELKLASAMTNPGRLKDLADVQELIRALRLPTQLADKLNPFVSEKYRELWTSVDQSVQEG